MNRLATITTTAALAAAATFFSLRLNGWAPMKKEIKLENAKVRVSEVTYLPGVHRERYIRPSDQVIVFLDESRYERIDSKTGEKTIRQRKPGEVIWHDKGEDAPVLTNLDAKPYRTLVIELK